MAERSVAGSFVVPGARPAVAPAAVAPAGRRRFQRPAAGSAAAIVAPPAPPEPPAPPAPEPAPEPADAAAVVVAVVVAAVGAVATNWRRVRWQRRASCFAFAAAATRAAALTAPARAAGGPAGPR